MKYDNGRGTHGRKDPSRVQIYRPDAPINELTFGQYVKHGSIFIKRELPKEYLIIPLEKFKQTWELELLTLGKLRWAA